MISIELINQTLIVHLKINISSTKQKNGSSSQIFKHTHRKQQFLTFPNILMNFSRQAEKRCSDKRKFEVFKIWNNKVLKSVRFWPNEINSTQCQLKVGIHLFQFQVRNLSCKFIYGKLFGIVLVGTIQSYRIDFCVNEAKITNNSISKKKMYWNTNFTPNLKKLEAFTRSLYYNQIQGPPQQHGS
ncbi:Hypothetical_protein [Hexamita inflata]|uniref:Hypothetical_protein n=1 Tax=Hexamita inflata TaxID=28002 RepID=A0AA86RWA7_9EUKA|nr:Hypothetical protein HINF_LOCUS66669 [Hexamita inflata]